MEVLGENPPTTSPQLRSRVERKRYVGAEDAGAPRAGAGSMGFAVAASASPPLLSSFNRLFRVE